jgi:hypothetical protein
MFLWSHICLCKRCPCAQELSVLCYDADLLLVLWLQATDLLRPQQLVHAVYNMRMEGWDLMNTPDLERIRALLLYNPTGDGQTDLTVRLYAGQSNSPA